MRVEGLVGLPKVSIDYGGLGGEVKVLNGIGTETWEGRVDAHTVQQNASTSLAR